MSIMLGNLNVKEIENRIGVEFPEEIRQFMKETKQENASKVEKGKWHCFDIPFTMVCGDFDTAKRIFDSVKDRAKEIKRPLKFTVQG